ncbi:TPA: amidohydrolase family protein [Klebsiella pneumoniae]|uniref:amidohydrolase family protein n=1 Tax=Klebsiella TaxID=570 RepID=UPI00227AEAD9|nr:MULTISPECIES: amidohydrolase family protein [Klebsiella]HCB2273209.1 amidohydrolase family protein [Citrobacter koseri]MCY4740890.1 amidohydrolase family protein [Klebsiella pneumoniae]MDQ9319964.1 amidohydrolase family protein [Klebsiella aerogenes]HBT2921225.1 amidohydrolase family protein [Klebsiella pneumoniae]HBT3406449.1 amidohydrolase family protein [Klebsiella pneumoniae]
MTTQRTLFKGGTILTLDANVPNLAVGDVLVQDGRIAAVGPALQADDAQIIDAAGHIVMPGLVDAHHHMWLGVMRRMMPNVDDLFAYIDVVAEQLGAHYRPLDMYLSTKLTAAASLDAGITTIIDACHSSRSPEHTDAALDALQDSGIRALHMVGAAMDKQASSAHLPGDLQRLAQNWNTTDSRVQVGLFGQLNLDWWKVARELDMRILTEFIGDLASLGPEFAKPGVLGTHNIFNHCTRVPQETWKLLADAGVNITVNPRSDALFGFDDETFAYQQAVDHGLTPALGIDLDTAFGSDMFGEMHALFGQQRSAMRYRRFRGEADAPAPISVEAVLQAATVNGARAAGLEDQIGTLTPGKQADIIMVRTNSVAVFPVTNAIGTIVQAVERADVDTVMVAGQLRKRAGKLLDVDLARLSADVTASRDYLIKASGYRADLFGTTA